MRALVLFVSAGLIALGSSLTLALADIESDMDIGIDRPGADIRNFALPLADPAACRQACTSDNRCVAWTFVKPGIQGPQAMCWLKDRVPKVMASGCCISGLMERAGGGFPPNPGPPVTVATGQTRWQIACCAGRFRGVMTITPRPQQGAFVPFTGILTNEFGGGTIAGQWNAVTGAMEFDRELPNNTGRQHFTATLTNNGGFKMINGIWGGTSEQGAPRDWNADLIP